MKTFILIINILLAGTINLTAQVPDSLKYHSLEPYDFHLTYITTDSSVLIDVREPFEYRDKRLKGAVNIPSSGNLDRAADTLNKSFSYFFYCTSGYRSSRAAINLYNKGFLKLYNLEGGISAWKKDGMPVVKKKGKKKSGS